MKSVVVRSALLGISLIWASSCTPTLLPPERAGLAADLPDRMRAVLQEQVDAGAFPGAVGLVARDGRVVTKVAVGRETYASDGKAVTVDTVYDLASLTKVCATLPALAVLLQRGTISLDDKLSKWVPEFEGPQKDAVTLRHVMVHSSGLPPYIQFYRKGIEGRKNIVSACARTMLVYEPGARMVYSDLGLILLMAVVERASGRPFDQFLASEVYPKLGTGLRFGSVGTPIAAAPTEDDAWRKRVVQGEVHDENAFAMGGVSGHAGLFGSAEDVAAIGTLFLKGCEGLVSAELARTLRTRDAMVPGSKRALLWDTFKKGGSGGSKLSSKAFGHTGFTGTSIWCDPETGLCMVLLTNRVHPTRKNRKISAARRAFHDVVADSVEGHQL